MYLKNERKSRQLLMIRSLLNKYTITVLLLLVCITLNTNTTTFIDVSLNKKTYGRNVAQWHKHLTDTQPSSFSHCGSFTRLSIQRPYNRIKRDFKKEKKKGYLMRQDNRIYKFSIKLFFSSIGQDKSKLQKEGRKCFYFTTHSTHFIYGYMASDIWLRTILIVRKETRCRHIGYSLRLTAMVLLYAPSHRQDSTYHGLCYTSRGALAGTRNSSMGSQHEGSIRRPIAPWANALTTELHLDPSKLQKQRIKLLCLYVFLLRLCLFCVGLCAWVCARVRECAHAREAKPLKNVLSASLINKHY